MMLNICKKSASQFISIDGAESFFHYGFSNMHAKRANSSYIIGSPASSNNNNGCAL